MDQPFARRSPPPGKGRRAAGNAYMVQLLCDGETAALPRAATLAALARRCGDVEGLPEHDGEQLVGFAFNAHAADGAPPPMATIAEAPPPNDDALAPVLEQTWDWPEAGDVARRMTRSILVSDMMATGLPPEERLSLFVNAVAALCDVAPVQAVLWLPAQKLIPPASLIRALDEPAPDPLFAPLNVRMFNVSGRERGETVMDTLGLAPLGLPDVQCHFVGLPPGRVAAFLHSVARYLFSRGPVIASGHTVAGPDGEKWRCRWKESIVAPARTVIDVEPSPAHAAQRP
jgi:hypothetical protein